MLRRIIWTAAVPALALVGLLLPAGAGRSQYTTSTTTTGGGFNASGAGTGLRTPGYYGDFSANGFIPRDTYYRYGSYGPYAASPDTGYPPIFFTSINYPGVYGMHTFGANATVLNVAPETSMIYYPPATRSTYVRTRATAVVPGEEKAAVDVHLPADAELWFDGHKVNLTGGFRQFETPPLTPVKNYHYDVRAA